MDDRDDVERGYCVYVHRDRASRTPFYVGKGKGGRAYDQVGRQPDWQAKVSSLPQGFEVEIVQSDLTEEEAYDLERELIRKYGKLSDGTGSLLNVTDGGSLDFGEASVELSFEIPPSTAEALKADYESKSYRKLPAEERASLTEALTAKMHELQLRYESAVVEDQETDFESEVDSLLWEVWNVADKYARRKVSSKDFAYEIEGLYEQTGLQLEEADAEKAAVVAVLRECLSLLRNVLDQLSKSGA